MTRNLARDRSGATALTVGVSIVALLGLVALGIDVGGWYNLRRHAQHAADSAAYSAAVAVGAGDDAAGQARAVAARYGFRHGVSGAAVLVNLPPATGAYAGDSEAVEVTVERPAPRFLSGLFVTAANTIRARAVGRVGAAADACVVAFNKVEAGSVLLNGDPNVNLDGCALYANSSNAEALLMKGGATLTASSIELVGGYSTTGQASIDADSGVHTGRRPISDPYADVAIPDYKSLACTSASGGSANYAPSPGGNVLRFCGDVRINSNAVVTFAPGVYVIDRGQLEVNGGATVTGKDVTIVLTSSTGSDYSTVSIMGGAVIDLKAPTTGPTAGLVFFQDRDAPSGVLNDINGGATALFQGALYFPRQQVRFNGGAAAGTGQACLQLLADEVQFSGNATFKANCEGTGVRLGGGGKPALVE